MPGEGMRIADMTGPVLSRGSGITGISGFRGMHRDEIRANSPDIMPGSDNREITT